MPILCVLSISGSLLYRKSPQPSQKKGKAPTQWHLAGTSKDQKELDFSNSTDMPDGDIVAVANEEVSKCTQCSAVSSILG